MRRGLWSVLVAAAAACGGNGGGGAADAQGGASDLGTLGDAVSEVQQPADVTADDAGPVDVVVDAANPVTADSTAADTATADVANDAGAPNDSAASTCAGPQPPNTACVGQNWVCKDGYFKPYGGGDCIEATCDNLTKAKNAAIEAVLATARTCTGGDPEECVVVATTTACGGTCGEAVSAGMANDLAKVVGWLDDNLCKPFDFPTKCGYSTPKCLPPKPACVKGQCVYAP